MLYQVLYALHTTYSGFNVFRYITFRTLLAGLTALVISFWLGPIVIEKLSSLKVGQQIREDGPERHLAKAGTPTMGGVLILFSGILATLLLADLSNAYIWLALMVTIGYAAIGFVDDYRKLRGRSSAGLSARQKFGLQLALGLIAGFVLVNMPSFSTTLNFPVIKGVRPEIGMWYVPFAALVIVGASNAVNLTDGLDGLAIGPVAIASATIGVFAYVAGNAKLAEYLQIAYVPGAGELLVFCGALVAAGLGFLWFNAYPAQMFMGDVGSLPLGAAIGFVALASKQELVLPLLGFVFVAEALSVIFQVASFKIRRKRIFKMAPIHHHFELMGWPEPLIIVRFWIIAIICALLALATLKLR
ncbi:MAG: phospho-N-acetylmuramoyl-pentapeptide-transferase [Deltaproteobacteria bacterium]|nr:phospho-N-acetylmuramoyl-pentapeptide-transferase [Deltaproteobacteria bacterium]